MKTKTMIQELQATKRRIAELKRQINQECRRLGLSPAC